MKLIGKLLVGSRQMLSSLREKAVTGALVVKARRSKSCSGAFMEELYS